MRTPSTHDLRWWKSTRSGTQGGNCVEVATDEARWLIRDSKNPDGGMLAASATQWRSFLQSVKEGQL